MPWAGMRGPLGQFAVPRAMPCLVCVAPLGQMEQWHFDPASMPKRASRSDVSARLRWSQSRHHVFVPMPQRGIAYQPRVPTLGIHQAKLTRVLKERRILSVSWTSTPPHPMRCSFRTHRFSRMRVPGLPPWAGMRCPVGAICSSQGDALPGMRCPLQGNLQFPGRCPAWYALPRWGKLSDDVSDIGHQRHFRYRRRPRVRYRSTTTFPTLRPCPNGGIAFHWFEVAPPKSRGRCSRSIFDVLDNLNT
jgi:hypothetical protein